MVKSRIDFFCFLKKIINRRKGYEKKIFMSNTQDCEVASWISFLLMADRFDFIKREITPSLCWYWRKKRNEELSNKSEYSYHEAL